MKLLRKIYRFWRWLLRCPFCGQPIRFNWWWLIDIDTYFYCRHCSIKLTQISFVVVVAMITFAIGKLYNFYQTSSAAHINVDAIIVKRAVLYFALIAIIRIILLFVLFRLKFSKIVIGKKKKPKEKTKEEYLWWEPFCNK